MTPGKEISFSEFLKEEALKPERIEQTEREDVVAEQQAPRFPNVDVAPEKELEEFWGALRHFFQTGVRPIDLESPDLLPALIAQNIRTGEWNTEFPFLLPADADREPRAIDAYLNEVFSDLFSADDAPVLKINLARLERELFDQVRKEGGFGEFEPLLERSMGVLRQLEVHGPEGEQFAEQLDLFEKALSMKGELIGFSPRLPLYVLNYLLQRDFSRVRKPFIHKIEQLKSGLRDLLDIEDEKHGIHRDSKDYDFADSMIALDQVDAIMPQNASEEIGERRLARIKEIYNILEGGVDLLSGRQAEILVNEQLIDNSSFDWEAILLHSRVIETMSGEGCIDARKTFKERIRKYTALISAVRMAELELKDRYRPEVHDVFFDHFSWHQFNSEELRVCPPVILIDSSEHILNDELNEYSLLLASNKPIRVIALKREPFGRRSKNGQLPQDEYAFRQELGALTLAHRNSYTLQSTTDHPGHMLNGMADGLAAPTPALFHLFVPGPGRIRGADEFIHNSAAVEGRFFPRFIYDHEKGFQWGSRFDISDNPQPENRWPVYPLEARANRGEEKQLEMAFTYVDYFALYPEHMNILFPIPPEYWTEDLIPLSDYLDSPSDELYGKIPFVWMIDESNALTRVAIPYILVRESQERLDFWNFIQELGGVNSYHVKQAMERTREELEEQWNIEKQELEKEYRQQVDEVEREAAGKAMEKLSSYLLGMGDLDNLDLAPRQKRRSESTDTGSAREELEEPEEQGQSQEEEEETIIPKEPWIETFRCTTCNECTDNYPAVFKYNEDKQAYIADASAATYKEMVWAAEECPAQCIHPGLPEDPDDPEMQEWIQRAKPFNE